MNKYPAYKDSGIEWIGEIPEHWDSKRFKYFVNLINDKSESNGIGFKVALENIESGTGRFTDETGSFDGVGNLFNKGDVLFNKLRPYLCKAVIVPEDGIGVGELLVLRTRQDTCSRFVLYRVLSDYFISMVNGSTYGAKMPRASWDFIGDMVLPFPLYNEQQAIADFLDKKTALIDDLIGKKKRQIELLKEQRQAVINQAVTKGLDPDVPMKDSGIDWLGEIPEYWEMKRLRYVFGMNTGLSVTKEELQESGIPIVNYGDIHTKYGFDLDVSRDELKFVDEQYISSKKSALATESDFVFCDTSEDIEGSGNCVYISKLNGSQIFAGSHTIIAKPIIEVNSKYLAYLFMAKSWRTQIQSKVYGVKVYSITQKILKDAIALLPPLFEQHQISDYLYLKTAKIDKSISKAEHQIELLQEYRTALISEVVTGKIDVRNEV